MTADRDGDAGRRSPAGAPITGVVGVLGGAAPDVHRQMADLAGSPGTRPDAVEVRFDLFDDPSQALGALRELSGDFPTIATVRLPRHGGLYRGSETDRVRLYRTALIAGATLVDAEWDSEAARVLAAEGAPIAASFHDFDRTLEPRALAILTERMEALCPRAVKVVPTATRPADGVDMLRWLEGSGPGRPRRVGFAMGSPGIPSRVLALAWGGAWTYGALGKTVAPGLPPVSDLKMCYRSTRIRRSTRIYGLLGSAGGASPLVRAMNLGLAAFELDAVYLPFAVRSCEEILPVIEALPIDALSVDESFAREALAFAHEAEDDARAAGRADVLLVRRTPGRVELVARRTRAAGLAARDGGQADLVHAYGQFCGLTGNATSRDGFERFRAAQGAR